MKLSMAGVTRLAALLLYLSPSAVQAYVPAHDEVVLEVLPTRLDPGLRQTEALRLQARARPGDAALAVDVARRYVETSRRLGDPRFLGYAEATLSPWRVPSEAPVDVLVLQAIVLQSRHQFEAAVQLLEQALHRDPGQAQAWLTLASIHQVRGDAAAARRACLPLLRHYDAGVSADCLSTVDVSGPNVDKAYARLVQRYEAPGLLDWQRAWLALTLAETATRLGRSADARRWYRVLKPEQADSYVKASYADFLLDSGQPAAVVALLAPHAAADPLLLRLAQASRQLQAPETARYIAMLDQRFAALRARGDETHLREEARFRLHLQQRGAEALVLAERNWQMQKEEADARLLLEAALAAGQPARAREVMAWVQRRGLRSVAIQALVFQLAARS